MRPGSTSPVTRSISDGSSGARSSNFCDVFIFLGCVTADTDCTDHFAVENNRNAALQWRRTRQGERCDATLAYLIFKYFAQSTENRCCPCFADSNFNAGDLRIIQTLEQQQVTTVIHENDDNRGAAFFRFCFCRGRDFLCGFKREDLFYRQVCFNRSAQKTKGDDQKSNLSHFFL